MNHYKLLLCSSLCVVLLQACASSQAIPFEVILPTGTLTPENTVTATAPTPTYTATPTLIGLKTFTPTVAKTPTPPGVILTVTPSEATITPTKYQPERGFVNVLVSDSIIYYGGSCQPSTVELRAQVSDTDRTFSVRVFTKVKELTTGASREWSSGTEMDNLENGAFMITLPAEQFHEEWIYSKDVQVSFQMVASTEGGTELGRTKIYKDRILVSPCAGIE
ncbi:MAG: hypothetical protein JXA13_04875 [Anaerolineales bacterium]|nr:hypothetical protein [Anaerolineales bacterium]